MKLNPFFIILIAAMGFMGSCNSRTPADTTQMNILFIAVEDWANDAIGCYGNEMVQTPNLDALAEKGIIFNRAYCQGVVCNPSRASITTGLRPDATRVYGNGDWYDRTVPEGTPYMAGILKQKGAHMAQTGKLMHKWFHSFDVINQFDQIEMEAPFAHPDYGVVDHEPDRGPFNGIQKYKQMIPDIVPPVPPRNFIWVPHPYHDSVLNAKMEDQERRLAEGEPSTWDLRKIFQQYHAEQIGDLGLEDPWTEDGMVTSLGVKMIEDFAEEGKQFFLNVGLYSPHTPLLAPKKYIDLYDTALIEISPATRDKDRGVPLIATRNGNNYDIFNGMYPEFQPTPARQKEAIAAYYGTSTFIDVQVGRLLQALEDNDIAENTIVILWADHGFHLGEHGCWSKYTLFEQSTRVPLIVYVPGAKGNGTACDEIVELVDMLPSMCDLWGIQKLASFEGTSFTPLLDDPGKAWKKAAFTIVPAPLRGRSVRTKQFKYAEYRKTMALPGEEEPIAVELYDLEADPLEQVNLAGNTDYISVEEELKELLKAGWKAALPE